MYDVHPLAILVGRELTDEEIRKATAAGNSAVEPLVEQRSKMLRAWDPSKPLTRDQMTTIMQQALMTAKETERNLVDMIAKVPSHWEAFVRREGGLAQLQQGINEALSFQAKIEKVAAPTVVPGFRDWIDHLLSRSESGVIAIAAVADILPDWLRARGILAGLQQAAIGAINAIVALGKGAAQTLGNLPTIAKVAGLAALAAGGIFVVVKVSSSSKKAS
jgi:hypothetical protein